MKVISVMNAKGGVAKTTSALCLASYLSKQGYRTLFLDLDPQANATSHLMKLEVGETPDCKTLYDVLHDLVMTKDKEAILKAIYPIEENLALVPASNTLEPLKDFVKSNSRNPLKLMTNVLKPIQDDFDFVLLDCPPDISVYVESAIFVSDFLLLPTTYDRFGFEGVAQVIGAINEIHEGEYENYKVLYTMVNPSATRIKAEMGKYEKMLDDLDAVLPFQIPIDQSVKNAQAQEHDLLNNKSYKNSRARLNYEKLGQYILEALA